MTGGDDRLTRVTWACVHFLTADTAAAAVAGAGGLRVRRGSGAGVVDPRGLFQMLQGALELPSYFGHNWDALLDLLRDLSWLGEARGYALVVEEGARLWQTAPDVAGALVELWLTAAEEWAAQGVSMHLVFVL